MRKVPVVAALVLAAVVGLVVVRLADRPVPGSELWVQRYNGSGARADRASSVAVSPDGNTIFVTGTSAGSGGRKGYATIAYSAATGTQLWMSRYAGPGVQAATPTAIAVSPRGDRVFVTGTAPDPAGGNRPGLDYVTVAYDFTTGAQLWASAYAGPKVAAGRLSCALAVAPDGRSVYITGATSHQFAVVGYAAATGARLWARAYGAARDFRSFDAASSVAVSTDSRTVFVAGASAQPYLRSRDGVYRRAPFTVPAVVTVAYRAADGSALWTRGYGEAPPDLQGFPAVAVSPTGRTVFVSGTSYSPAARSGAFVTVAYDVAGGARRWAALYRGPAHSGNWLAAMAPDPAGKMLYVTGSSAGLPKQAGTVTAVTTVAYHAATGTRAWVRQVRARSWASAAAIAVGRPGTVYVSGTLDWGKDVTAAYSASGTPLWIRSFSKPGHQAVAVSEAASPGSGDVYVTGWIVTGRKLDYDYLTFAYAG